MCVSGAVVPMLPSPHYWNFCFVYKLLVLFFECPFGQYIAGSILRQVFRHLEIIPPCPRNEVSAPGNRRLSGLQSLSCVLAVCWTPWVTSS